jgi:hypothetical protein
MSGTQIREYAQGKGFHPQTLKRWLGWNELDREALFRLVAGLKIGENHLRDLMDWVEESALRDGSSIQDILASKAIADIESDPRLGRADKLKRIKEQIRRLRFPRLAETEDAIRARIQELKLQPQIRLTVPPGLEGGNLHVEFDATTLDDLKRFTAKLSAAAEKDCLKEIFGLLAGEPQPIKPK